MRVSVSLGDRRINRLIPEKWSTLFTIGTDPEAMISVSGDVLASLGIEPQS